MRDVEFTKLLNRLAKAQQKAFRLSQLVSDECINRHGVHYSEIDCDELIDTLDLTGADKITASEFDKAMEYAKQVSGYKELTND